MSLALNAMEISLSWWPQTSLTLSLMLFLNRMKEEGLSLDQLSELHISLTFLNLQSCSFLIKDKRTLKSLLQKRQSRIWRDRSHKNAKTNNALFVLKTSLQNRKMSVRCWKCLVDINSASLACFHGFQNITIAQLVGKKLKENLLLTKGNNKDKKEHNKEYSCQHLISLECLKEEEIPSQVSLEAHSLQFSHN